MVTCLKNCRNYSFQNKNSSSKKKKKERKKKRKKKEEKKRGKKLEKGQTRHSEKSILFESSPFDLKTTAGFQQTKPLSLILLLGKRNMNTAKKTCIAYDSFRLKCE